MNNAAGVLPAVGKTTITFPQAKGRVHISPGPPPWVRMHFFILQAIGLLHISATGAAPPWVTNPQLNRAFSAHAHFCLHGAPGRWPWAGMNNAAGVLPAIGKTTIAFPEAKGRVHISPGPPPWVHPCIYLFCRPSACLIVSAESFSCPIFKKYKDRLRKKIAVGVISHRTLQADFPNVIADRIRRCLEFIPAEKLVLSTDCGFGRQGFNRHLAFYKAAGIPMARNIILKELGLPERYVPAADERLAWDQLPDHEPFTHLKPLR